MTQSWDAAAIRISRQQSLASVLAGPLALVLAMSVINPTWALRWGAVVCGVAAASAILLQWRPQVPDVAMLTLVMLGYASRYWSDLPTETAVGFENYLGLGAVFLGVRAVTGVNPRTHLTLARGYVLGCAYAAINLILEAGEIRLRIDATAERIALDNEVGATTNYLAYCFAGGVALLALLWHNRRPALLGRLASYLFVATMAAAINLTGSRGAAVGFVLTLAWLVFQRFCPNRGWWWLWGGISAMNLIIVTGVLDGQLARLAGNRLRDTGTLNGRLLVWPDARETFLESPFIGLGLHVFPERSVIKAAAHNALLDIGVALGLVGLALFGVVTVWVLFVESTGHSERTRLLGTFAIAVAPALATGYWVESPALWGLLGLLTASVQVDGKPDLLGSRELVRHDRVGNLHLGNPRGTAPGDGHLDRDQVQPTTSPTPSREAHPGRV